MIHYIDQILFSYITIGDAVTLVNNLILET